MDNGGQSRSRSLFSTRPAGGGYTEGTSKETTISVTVNDDDAVGHGGVRVCNLQLRRRATTPPRSRPRRSSVDGDGDAERKTPERTVVIPITVDQPGNGSSTDDYSRPTVHRHLQLRRHLRDRHLHRLFRRPSTTPKARPSSSASATPCPRPPSHEGIDQRDHRHHHRRRQLPADMDLEFNPNPPTRSPSRSAVTERADTVKLATKPTSGRWPSGSPYPDHGGASNLSTTPAYRPER